MNTDKDKPWTWLKYKDGMCKDCWGSCCTMPVEVRAEDLVRLGLVTNDEIEISKKKVAKKLIREGYVVSYRDSSELYMLVHRPNGDCYFLDSKSRLCTVYDRRPDVCRDFPKIGPKPGFCPKKIK